MGISLLDLVTEHQSGEENTLRKIIEKSGQDFDVSDANKPLELETNIFLWERKEDIRDEMPEGTYVVIDAMYFSTTSIELFNAGLEEMTLCKTHDEVRALEDIELKIGEGRDESKMKEGMQMINSPSYAVENYAGQNTAAMISYNGARAAVKIIEGTEDSRILIGSSTNAAAVAEELHGEEKIHLVSAGDGGVHRAEDHIAAYIITQEIEDELEDSERMMLTKMIDLTADLHYDGEVPKRRLKDVEILKQVNSRNFVPEFDRDDNKLKRQR